MTTNIVKRCQKDGVEFPASHPGPCESCHGPIYFYCKIHDQWLVDETCNRCRKADESAPAAAGTNAKNLFGVIAVLAVLVAFLVLGGIGLYFAFRYLTQPTPATAPNPPPPAVSSPAIPPPAPAPTPIPTPAPAPVPPRPKPTPPPPAPVLPKPALFPDYPPVPLTMNEILVDGEPYLGKLIQTTGVVQLHEPAQEQFVLQSGNHSLEVRYGKAEAGTKTALARAPAGAAVTVTGLLQRDETYNAWYLTAQRVQIR